MTIFGPHTGIPSLAASRLQRWALLLSGHSYDIKYRKSEAHCNADGLSRLPLPVEKPDSNTIEILYFREVEEAPVSAMQVKKATRNDPVLSAVMDLIIKGLPAGPYEDRMFLDAVDAHSKWPEVTIMKSTTTEKTREALGEIFSRFGSPTQLVSDNGPQLVSQEMDAFLQANGVQHITSAPYHSATNGLAERFSFTSFTRQSKNTR
ncbi:hypothetical protein L3Q82_006335 [Scortum barcoo]|uniref:Uncharacterized protein n=1 Tax=Scortum barcoo TaxID=214431 RepID=A0ACB8WZ30_9TELE|nr:hypothetical protein L3Q82_006335 [Scortum barcoo]